MQNEDVLSDANHLYWRVLRPQPDTNARTPKLAPERVGFATSRADTNLLLSPTLYNPEKRQGCISVRLAVGVRPAYTMAAPCSSAHRSSPCLLRDSTDCSHIN